MRPALWFTSSAPLDGLYSPPTTLISYTVNTAFEITDHRLGLLRQQPWVETVTRRRRDLGLVLVVRVGYLPAELAGANCDEAFRTQLLRLLRGW
jgi:hypothetical protein